MKVAIVSGPRSLEAMGLEVAERSLIDAVRNRPEELHIDVRVAGGRAARRYARSLGARWIPARPGRLPQRALRGADLVHLLALDFRPPRDTPYVLTLHDLGGLQFPDEAQFPDWTAEAVGRAVRLIAPSRFTADQLHTVLDVPVEKIRVVANGPGQAVSPDTAPLTHDELAALGIHHPFALRMGGYTKRKNVPLLLEAWPEIWKEAGLSLVLTGPLHDARRAQLDEAPSLDGIVVLDHLPSATLSRLIRSASLLVSTSTYEGFGLPPLEAMRAGVPVVAVRAPAVEEVCGDAALLVANDRQALVDGVLQTQRDPELRERMVAVGLRRAEAFTWERAAEALRSVYRELSVE